MDNNQPADVAYWVAAGKLDTFPFSIPRFIESAYQASCLGCLQALQAAGYPLISSNDARNKRVPKATKTAKKSAKADSVLETQAESVSEGVASSQQQEAFEAGAAY